MSGLPSELTVVMTEMAGASDLTFDEPAIDECRSSNTCSESQEDSVLITFRRALPEFTPATLHERR
jgi:hypothetical protein